MHDKVLQARIDAFAETFLNDLRPIPDAGTPRDLVRQVFRVCDDFARREGDPRFSIIPLSFRMRFAEAFLGAYPDTEDEGDLLAVARQALIALMQEYARAHNITLEDLNA